MTEPMTTARRFTFLRGEDPANCAGVLRLRDPESWVRASEPKWQRPLASPPGPLSSRASGSRNLGLQPQAKETALSLHCQMQLGLERHRTNRTGAVRQNPAHAQPAASQRAHSSIARVV